MKKGIRLGLSVENIAFLIMWAMFFQPPVAARVSNAFSYLLTLLGLGCFLMMLFRRPLILSLRDDLMYVLAFLMYCAVIVLFRTPGEFSVFARRYLIYAVESIFLIRWSFEGEKEGLKSLYHVCAFYITATFLSLVLFPGGMIRSHSGSSVERAQWLFGSKNNIPLYMIIFIALAAYYYYTVAKSKVFYALAAMAFFNILMSGENGLEMLGGSSTGAVGFLFVLMLIMYYIYARRTNRAAFGVKGIFALILLVNAILLTGQSVPGMNDFIVNVFHKSVTFSGRTRIWATNLQAVGDHLFFGHGEQGIMAHVKLQKEWVNTDYTYNCIVKILVNYGIVGLGIFIMMILKIFRGQDTGDRILFCGFFGVMIIGLMNEVELNWLLLFPMMLTALPMPLEAAGIEGGTERSLGLQIRF